MVPKVEIFLLNRFRFRAEPANLKILLDRVINEAEKQNIDKKSIFRIRLSVEEAVSNIIHHAYPDKPGNVSMSCFKKEGNIFSVEIEDTGTPFNLTDVESPDVTSKLDNRDIGGLGIHLIKNSADRIYYSRRRDKNILTLEYNYL